MVDVVALVDVDTVVIDEQLTVGCLCVAVTVREIVDHDLEELSACAGLLKIPIERRDLLNLVEPDERRDVLDFGGLRLQRRIRDEGDGMVDLSSVVRAQVDLREVIQSGAFMLFAV